MRNLYKHILPKSLMEKRGDGGLTARQFIIILISLLGFVLVLALLVQLYFLNDISDYEICHTSVISRATTPQAESQYVPLKCNTKKICLTSDKDCVQFIGESKVTKLSIEEKRHASTTKIKKTKTKTINN